MRHIPSWFPGAGFKNIARQYKNTFHEFMERPLAFVRQEMVNLSCQILDYQSLLFKTIYVTLLGKWDSYEVVH